ncbi:hypothetical protein HTG_08280 [Natrinema mahii]|nr:hypothetical protein HTG_08280 [Natrinema mahii]
MDLRQWAHFTGGSAGATNLTCPKCKKRIDTLAFTVHDPSAIQAEERFTCPNCSFAFWPENALLLTLLELDGNSYFGFPFSLGGNEARNYTSIEVGKTREYNVDTLAEGYTVETITLKGAHRKDIPKSDWLPLEPLNNPFRRAMLGESVSISLAKNTSKTVSVSTNLVENPEHGINLGDEIEILYDATTSQNQSFDPPWILLLQEATFAIRRDNTVTALPLLISSFDNLLFRQLYLLLRDRGLNQEESVNKLQSFKQWKFLKRDDLAKDALDFAVGERLSDGRYAEEWAEFKQLVNTRSEIIHPTNSSSLNRPDRDEVIEQFNKIIRTMLCVFDLCWRY